MLKSTFSCKSKGGSSEQPSSFRLVRQRASNIFSRRSSRARATSGSAESVLQSGARRSAESARGPENYGTEGRAASIRSEIQGQSPANFATFSSSSSSRSSMLSLWETSWASEASEYDDHVCTNTLDAELGRRLQALQNSMCNPDLSPTVRSILAAAYRQFEKQSARNRETLPAYSMDGKPPPYEAHARD